MEENHNTSYSVWFSIVQYTLIMIKIIAIIFLLILTIETFIRTSSTPENPFIENKFLSGLFIIFLLCVFLLQIIYISINFVGVERPTFMQSVQIFGSIGLMLYTMTNLPVTTLINVSLITISSISLCAIIILIVCAISDPECNFKRIVIMAKNTFFSWNLFPNIRYSYDPIK